MYNVNIDGYVKEYTKWVESVFYGSWKERKVEDLLEEISSGLLLIDLANVILWCNLPHLHIQPQCLFERKENVQLCLQVFHDENIHIYELKARAIASGDVDSILALCCFLQRYFSWSTIMKDSRSSMNNLLLCTENNNNSTLTYFKTLGTKYVYEPIKSDEEIVSLFDWMWSMTELTSLSGFIDYQSFKDGLLFFDVINQICDSKISLNFFCLMGFENRIQFILDTIFYDLDTNTKPLDAYNIINDSDNKQILHLMKILKILYERKCEEFENDMSTTNSYDQMMDLSFMKSFEDKETMTLDFYTTNNSSMADKEKVVYKSIFENETNTNINSKKTNIPNKSVFDDGINRKEAFSSTRNFNCQTSSLKAKSKSPNINDMESEIKLLLDRLQRVRTASPNTNNSTSLSTSGESSKNLEQQINSLSFKRKPPPVKPKPKMSKNLLKSIKMGVKLEEVDQNNNNYGNTNELKVILDSFEDANSIPYGNTSRLSVYDSPSMRDRDPNDKTNKRWSDTFKEELESFIARKHQATFEQNSSFQIKSPLTDKLNEDYLTDYLKLSTSPEFNVISPRSQKHLMNEWRKNLQNTNNNTCNSQSVLKKQESYESLLDYNDDDSGTLTKYDLEIAAVFDGNESDDNILDRMSTKSTDFKFSFNSPRKINPSKSLPDLNNYSQKLLKNIITPNINVEETADKDINKKLNSSWNTITEYVKVHSKSPCGYLPTAIHNGN